MAAAPARINDHDPVFLEISILYDVGVHNVCDLVFLDPIVERINVM